MERAADTNCCPNGHSALCKLMPCSPLSRSDTVFKPSVPLLLPGGMGTRHCVQTVCPTAAAWWHGNQALRSNRLSFCCLVAWEPDTVFKPSDPLLLPGGMGTRLCVQTVCPSAAWWHGNHTLCSNRLSYFCCLVAWEPDTLFKSSVPLLLPDGMGTRYSVQIVCPTSAA